MLVIFTCSVCCPCLEQKIQMLLNPVHTQRLHSRNCLFGGQSVLSWLSWKGCFRLHMNCCIFFNYPKQAELFSEEENIKLSDSTSTGLLDLYTWWKEHCTQYVRVFNISIEPFNAMLFPGASAFLLDFNSNVWHCFKMDKTEAEPMV